MSIKLQPRPKLRIVVGMNTLDPSTWVTYDNVPLLKVLRENFGDSLPSTTRLFHDIVDEEHALTFQSEEDCHNLLRLKGTLYVLVYPASPANLFLTSALLLTSVILQAIFPEERPDPGRPPRTGSPSVALGNRTNRARPLARVPDYFGKNRITPDMIAKPLTIYDAQHRETEINQMILGRGTYSTNDTLIYEGDTLAKNAPGLSVEVYSPGSLPTFGTPDVQIGPVIDFPVTNVYQLEAVNGLRLAPLNEKTLHGTVFQRPYTKDFDESLSGFEYAAMGFVYDGGSVGRILIPLPDPTSPSLELTPVTDKIVVGDRLECRFDPLGVTSVPAGSFDRNDRTRIGNKVDTAFPAAAPNLSDDNFRYEITSIFPTAVISGGVAYAEVTIDIPAGKLAEWAAIPAYMTGPSNVMFCVSVLLTPILAASGNFVNEHGAFFIDDPLMTSVLCNFVAERGLFTDDGKNAAAVNPKIAVFLAPADAAGVATGPFERFTYTIPGSATDTSTRALTVTIDAAAGLTFTGRCLISVIREDFGLWRVEDPGQGAFKYLVSGIPFVRAPLLPVGGAYPPSIWNPASVPPAGPYSAIYRARKGTVEDQVRWTHCYALSDPGVPAFGDTTLIMTKTVASKAANVRPERKLSVIATRMIGFWNGTIFTGPLAASREAMNIFFSILKDPLLGNIPNAQIDFFGIADAFQAVQTYFNDNEFTRFDHCFDSENGTLEDMLAQVAESCFCIAYREGQVIKVKPNIATDSAVLLFNHRNMLADSETRVVTFGPEADYNGARVDYQDDLENTLKSITVPVSGRSRPREISVAGIHSVKKAGVHAWRAHNRIQNFNTSTEFRAASEAALCSINDKILVADQTQSTTADHATQDGELRGVSGLNIFTTQPVDIATGGPYTVHLQHVDGTVEAIAVSGSTNPQSLTLASAPSQPLVVDDTLGVRTKYQLIAATTTRPQAFLVTDKSPDGVNTWSIKASNYSHTYYEVDSLQAWVNPGVVGLSTDLSPYKRTFTVTGSATTTSNPTRGSVYIGTGIADYIEITPSSLVTTSVSTYFAYSKTAWIHKTSTGNAVDILSMSTPANDERFLISNGDELRVFHNGIAVVSHPGWPLADWHLAGVSYDNIAGTARVFIDGLLVASASGLALLNTPRSTLRALAGLIGMADDVRLYRRALLDSEHLELYHKTRIF